MNSIESWGAVIGLVAYFLFKFVGKVLNSPVDPEAPTAMPIPEPSFPELDRKDDLAVKKIILENALSERRAANKSQNASSRFGEKFVESKLDHSSPIGEKVEEEETANIRLDFSNYDELKKGILYSEIFQRKY